MGAYVLDNAWEHERERLAGLEEKLDPGTTRYLDAVGVGAGWICLETGGGGGSITQWLCRRVAPTGRVVAPDRGRPDRHGHRAHADARPLPRGAELQRAPRGSPTVARKVLEGVTARLRDREGGSS